MELAALPEAATELAQTELELALQSTTPEERQSARLNAAVAGGLVGGTLGTATGLRASAEQQQRVLRENEVGELDMTGSDAPAVDSAVTEPTVVEPTDLSTLDAPVDAPVDAIGVQTEEQLTPEAVDNMLDSDLEAEPVVARAAEQNT